MLFDQSRPYRFSRRPWYSAVSVSSHKYMEQEVNNHVHRPRTFLSRILRGDRVKIIDLCSQWQLDAARTNVLLRCVKNGVVFVHEVDGVFTGVTALETMEDNVMYLHMLPKTYGKEFLTFVTHWARQNGVREIQVSSSNLNGSCFRYFEKTLGFRRKVVVFSLDLWQTQR